MITLVVIGSIFQLLGTPSVGSSACLLVGLFKSPLERGLPSVMDLLAGDGSPEPACLFVC